MGHAFNAKAAQIVLSVLRGEISPQEGEHQIRMIRPEKPRKRKWVQECVVREHTCITHGNNAGTCGKERL